jgi:hypothetical protein
VRDAAAKGREAESRSSRRMKIQAKACEKETLRTLLFSDIIRTIPGCHDDFG